VLDAVETIANACSERGLDLVHAFGIDRRLPAGSALRCLELPDFGRPRALGLLIGNSRALWPVFESALRDQAALREAAHPLDCYVVTAVNEARAALAARSFARFAHLAEPNLVPIQRIAEEVGFAHLAPSHLSIHPAHGPWIALRAVVVVDLDGPAPLPPAPDPCTPCNKPCLVALAHAVAHPEDWRAWLSIRDACPVARGSRYGEAQVTYHYTKDRALLRH